MRQSLARFSASVSSFPAPSWADFITTTLAVHTTYRCCPGTIAKIFRPHSCALECPILQHSGLLVAWTGLITLGFSVITNTTRQSSVTTNTPRLKTSLIPTPMHFPFCADTAPQRPIPLPWHVATRGPVGCHSRSVNGNTRRNDENYVPKPYSIRPPRLLARSLTVWEPRAGFPSSISIAHHSIHLKVSSCSIPFAVLAMYCFRAAVACKPMRRFEDFCPLDVVFQWSRSAITRTNMQAGAHSSKRPAPAPTRLSAHRDGSRRHPTERSVGALSQLMSSRLVSNDE
jgi:hypothetical protein